MSFVTFEADHSFVLTENIFNDTNCTFSQNIQQISGNCNYTKLDCCNHVEKNYNVTFGLCVGEKIYNCQIMKPEEEIFVYILFCLTMLCMCCGVGLLAYKSINRRKYQKV